MKKTTDKLLNHYAKREPKKFLQIDGWYSRQWVDDRVLAMDEARYSMTGGATVELMHGTDVRILIDPSTPVSEAVMLLRQAVAWLKEDPLLYHRLVKPSGGSLPPFNGAEIHRERINYERNDRWLQLSILAGTLEDDMEEDPSIESTSCILSEFCFWLESILEDFPKPQDPLADFEGYAVHRMAYWLLKRVRFAQRWEQNSNGRNVDDRGTHRGGGNFEHFGGCPRCGFVATA